MAHNRRMQQAAPHEGERERAMVPPFVLLEDRVSGKAGGRLFTRPVERVRCERPSDVPAALDRLQAGLDRGLHAAGYISYEAGQILESRLAGLRASTRAAPALYFGLFQAFRSISAETLDAWFSSLAPPPPIQNIQPGHSRAQHVAKVKTIQTLIAAGDVYQVNLTFPIHFRYHGDPLALYAALRARQPVAHGGIVALGGATVLSVSPELFIASDGNRITTRPMKGTAARGATPAADRAIQHALVRDLKQRAENLMIVDLMRNDLSRICQIGSVRTPALHTVETYPGFHALTSTVEGALQPGLQLHDILRAIFPCGSIVGAPKIRAAEIIAQLEDAPGGRGVYTGAIGAISPDGSMHFNVAIRTATLTNGVGRFGVGGGIVADSNPDAEYDEALLKARILTDLAEDFQLIETLRWTAATGLVNRAAHLARLADSAAELGFTFTLETTEHMLDAAARRWRAGPDQRVRLLLRRQGQLDIAAHPLLPEPNRLLRLGVHHQALDAADPFLRHKTTRRAVYDAATATAAATGFDEMILLNRHGALADGARNSVFIARDGRLLTPPVAAGALPGILRAQLLATGAAIEAPLTPPDLQTGRLYIGNSLRGLRECRL